MSRFTIDNSSDFKLEVSLLLAIAALVDTPLSREVIALIQDEKWEEYLDLKIDPSNYEDLTHFADDHLICSLLSKSPNFPIKVDRAKAAKDSYFESETRCKETNLRLLDHARPEWFRVFQDQISRILGPLTHSDLKMVERGFKFGPGATSGVKGTGTTSSDKIIAEMHMTAELAPYWREMMGARWAEDQSSMYKHRIETRDPVQLNLPESPQWKVRLLVNSIWSPFIVKGGEFFTVPKKARTDRGCDKQPTLNVFGQLSVGSLLRLKLKHFGLDLNTQTDVNRKLAQKAYSLGLCTIDLKAASDTVCWALVFLAFPERWFELLDLFRTKYILMDKGSEPLLMEKFSSMGNGFTFEVESLIFFALALTVVPRGEQDLVTVFGDDIILPRAYASEYIERLEYLGFETNSSKSFLAGSFFESCGTDWFKGNDVRPFFLKGSKDPEEEVQGVPYVLRIANKLRLYAARRGACQYADSRFFPIYQELKSHIPFPWNSTKTPAVEGDNGIITSYDEAMCLPRHPCFENMRVGTAVKVKPVLRKFNAAYRLVATWLQKASINTVGAYNECQLSPEEYKPKACLPKGVTFVRNKWSEGKPYKSIVLSRPIYPQGRRLRKCDLYSHQVSNLEEVRFSRNSEPVRGLFGRCVTERRPMYWVPDGLTWG